MFADVLPLECLKSRKTGADYDLQVARYNATVLVQVLKAPLGHKKKEKKEESWDRNGTLVKRGGGGVGEGEERCKSMMQR